jgi:phage recombination protein Bet
MTGDLTVIHQHSARDLVTFSNEQINLIKRTICKPKEREATNDELALFIGQAKRTGLDPFAKQIYAVFRKSHGVEQMTIQTAIDGFRLIAERTGKYAGKLGTWWCGPDRVWHEVWIDAAPPVAAKVTVQKAVDGLIAPTPAVAHWKEYAARDYKGNLTSMWQNMPANQLAKCAEALALRQAFPNELSGLYTADEMAQANNPASAPQPVQQPPARVIDEYVEVEPAPTLSKATQKALRAAVDAAGIDKNWLLKNAVAIGVENTAGPHWLSHITEDQAKHLMQALSDEVDRRDAEEQVAEVVVDGLTEEKV